MKVVVDYVSQAKVPSYKLKNNNGLPLLRGFMDDISLMCRSVPAAQIALHRVREVVEWARMKLKPAKSRSAVLVRGGVMEVEPFSVDGTTIPSIQRKPVKTLGRIFDGTLNDRKAREELEVKVKDRLRLIDRSLFTGFMKLWILHHILVPKISWHLMIYEIPVSSVERLEVKISKHIRKWLGVRKMLNRSALYCKEVP